MKALQASVSVESSFDPTEEQSAIEHLFNRPDHPNVKVIARAGSGKTATARYLTHSTTRRGVYLAFGKKNADEARAKFPAHMLVKTTHALAYAALNVREHWGHKLKNEKNKWPLWRIIQEWGIQKQDGISAEHLAYAAQQGLRNFLYSADPQLTRHHVQDRSKDEAYFAEQLLSDYQRAHPMATEQARERWAKTALPVRVKTLVDRYTQKLYEIAGALWEAQISPRHPFPMEHDTYLKLWQLSQPIIPDIEYLIIDECFPAGTLVETDCGPTPIEVIAADPSRNWQVLSSKDGGETLLYSPVTAAYKTPTQTPLVRIVHESGEFVCTANHPIWVKGYGWKPAGSMQAGDAMSGLRNTQVERIQNLFQEVRFGMAGNEQNSRTGTTAQRKNQPSYENSTHLDSESYGADRCSRESISYAQKIGEQLYSQGRERIRPHTLRSYTPSRTDPSASELALEHRGCRLQWAKEAGNTNLLQNRHRIIDHEDSYRGRRELSPGYCQESDRREKNFRIDFTRVVCVEVLERGNLGRCERRSVDDSCVYTLSVDSGSYFAAGILVKNCQDSNPCVLDIVLRQLCQVVMVGDPAQSIFSFRRAINALDRFDAETLYLSLSFRFGQPIAEVANAILRLAYPDLVPIRGHPRVHSTLGPIESGRYALVARTNAGLFDEAVELARLEQRFHVVGSLKDPIERARSAYHLWAESDPRLIRHPDIKAYDDWFTLKKEAKYDVELARYVRLILEKQEGVLELCELLEQAGEVPAKQAEVVLTTLHKSKGLEFPQVRMAEDFSRLKIDETGKVAGPLEEFNVLYVAATRAQRRVELNAIAQAALDQSLPRSTSSNS